LRLDIGMVAADTTRTRAYLHALIRQRLLPSYVLVLENLESSVLPGQLDRTASPPGCGDADGDWSEADFDTGIPLGELLDSAAIEYEAAPSRDINDPAVVALIARRPESVMIYSGYGGVLLKADVLASGKRFLHVHGGYLPDYKGSTTNFYSLLAENTMGASAIFLTEQIDSGPILLRRTFPAPAERVGIDHIFDSAARAKVLVEVLQSYSTAGDWDAALENRGGDTYYVIHPVLKHIAIMARG
jgi:methionyl-tRNA formyltransferase